MLKQMIESTHIPKIIISKELGIDRGTLNKILDNKASLKAEQIKPLAKILKITPLKLLDLYEGGRKC